MVMAGAPAQEPLAQAFVKFCVEAGALKFGEFKTKAGRLSPYFFNAGLFDDGAKLGRLAAFYARALVDSGIGFDMIFGPAYKGIPLGAAVAIELARLGRNVPFAYNRKEAKDHGEGGTLVGAPLKGRVLIVDDVMSALDRQEKATEASPDGTVRDVDHSAVQYVQRQLGLQVCAIARLDDLLQYLNEQPGGEIAAHRARVLAYRERYGVKDS
jgi:orotate phosphoribosyltransferase